MKVIKNCECPQDNSYYIQHHQDTKESQCSYLDLLGGEGRQTGAHRVSHGLRVVTLEDGVQEPAVPEIYHEKF